MFSNALHIELREYESLPQGRAPLEVPLEIVVSRYYPIDLYSVPFKSFSISLP